MKRVLVCAVVFVYAVPVAAAMVRVVEIPNSRTVVVLNKGITTVVSLRDVHISPEDEPAASAYLRRALADTWVYVENGEVYRSPDGFYVNGAMKRHAWLGMTYLGKLDLGLRQEKVTRDEPPRKSKKVSAPTVRKSRRRKRG